MFVWCETFPRCLSIDGWTALGYYNYARSHNQQYTQKLNIQQQSIYKITTVNIHKQISFSPPGFEPQTSGSLARKSSMLPLGHPVIPVWCFISWKLLKFVNFVATRGKIFSLKFTKYRLAAGLRPDPLGELKRSPRPPSRNKGSLLLRGGEGRGG